VYEGGFLAVVVVGRSCVFRYGVEGWGVGMGMGMGG
jgi:hypothetical protein